MILNTCRPAFRLASTFKLIYQSSGKKINQAISSTDYLVPIFLSSFLDISDPANSKLSKCLKLSKLPQFRILSNKLYLIILLILMLYMVMRLVRLFRNINLLGNSNRCSLRISFISLILGVGSILIFYLLLSREIYFKILVGILPILHIRHKSLRED